MGPIRDWPQSLRTTVELMLASRFPMFTAWGKDLTFLYNDAYAEILGGKHPQAMGRPFKDIWTEIWTDIEPMIKAALDGRATYSENLPLLMNRMGHDEQAWFTFSYSPVRGDDGQVAGMFCACVETTERVVADRRREEAAERLEMALSAGDGVGTWDWDVPSDRVQADERFARIYGVDPDKARRGAPLVEFFRAIHPTDIDRVQAEIADALATGKTFSSEYRLIQPDGEARWVAAQGRASLSPEGRPQRFPGVTFDITERRRMIDALAESEARYRTLFDTIQYGFCIVQMKFDEAMRPVDYMIVEGNAAFEEMTGLRDANGKWVSDIAPGLERHWFDLYGGVALTGEPARFENPADIFGRWYEGQALRVGDPAEHRVAILFNNVTVQKQAEMRQKVLLDLNDAVRDLTDPGEIAHASSRILAEALHVSRVGYGVMDTVAETVTIARDYNAPGVRSIAGVIQFRDFGNYIEDLARGETVVFADAAADPRVDDGGAALDTISARSLINLPLIEQGRVVALLFVNNASPRVWLDEEVALVREVAERVRVATERARAVTALRDSEARLARLLAGSQAELERLWELSPDLLTVVDYEGRLERINPSWTRVLGHSEERLLTRPYVEILHPDEIASIGELLADMRASEQPVMLEDRLLTADGNWRTFVWTLSPEPGGERLYGVGRDVTDERAQAQELAKAHEALRQSQKMEAVGQLTGGIAHDFNNLLAGISGALELLGKRLDEGRLNGMERYIDAAQGSAQRAAALTQRLLAFSRRQTLDPKPTDVNRLIAGMADLIRRSVGPSVEVEVVGADGLWPTLIDPSQLENSLLNLCINARDAMAPDGGRLTIETANKWLDDRAARERDLMPGQYISLCVTDTGSGMTPEVQAKAFDPFFTTKPLGQGTGLGLSMIHGFVRQSGGQVRIYSEIGKGTTMCLYLPRHGGELDAAETVADVPVAEGGHGETVLVIDDEETVRMLVAEVLIEAGYHVIEAPDGPSGLDILRTDRRLDLLISDVGLPGGMNGRQVADAARVGRPDLKVLFITGYAENAAVGNGLLAPGMEVITKPFVMAELALKVHDMIEG